MTNDFNRLLEADNVTFKKVWVCSTAYTATGELMHTICRDDKHKARLMEKLLAPSRTIDGQPTGEPQQTYFIFTEISIPDFITSPF